MASNTIIEKYPLYNLGISGEEVERTLKNSAQKADVDVLQERINKIKYYGDADIEISPDEWFVFNDEEHTVLGGLSEGHENETSIVIPYSVTIVGEGAFTHCESLTSVTMPNSVTTIRRQAFGNCTHLTSVTISDGVTSIGKLAFFCCTSLTSVIVPDRVTSIGKWTFDGCRSLTNITIGNSVTSIGDDAFDGCTNLTIYCEQGSYADTYAKENNIPIKYTDIYIDKKITENSENAVSSGAVFEEVERTLKNSAQKADVDVLQERINKIKYYGDADIEISPDEWFVFNDEEHTILGGFSEGHENETSIVIPYSVTAIASEAFFGCSSLTSVTMPNSVTTILRQAFGNCTHLTSVTISDGVTSIGKLAFFGCTSLTSVIVPDRVTSIGKWTFYGCTSLTSINIPNSVTGIYDDAFDGCTNLTIYCEQGSYADTFAREYNIPVRYPDVSIDKKITENSENAVSSGAVFEAVSEMNNSIGEAVSIAKGRATGYVFDTLADLDAWLEDIDNMHRLVVGDNLYIRAIDVPDYWWDGEQKQQLETQKVDLSEYYTKNEISAKIDEVSDIADEAKSDSLQAMQETQQALANADYAIEIAKSVRADADNGVFNGKDGADYIITEADKEEIKADVVETLTRSSTALPEMLDVNTIYDLGEQDALTLNLPSGKLGDFIEVDFLSTQTPTTLTITASSGMSDYNLIPDANTIYSLYFNWIRLDVETYGWGFGYAEYTRMVTE